MERFKDRLESNHFFAKLLSTRLRQAASVNSPRNMTRHLTYYMSTPTPQLLSKGTKSYDTTFQDLQRKEEEQQQQQLQYQTTTIRNGNNNFNNNIGSTNGGISSNKYLTKRKGYGNSI